MISQVVQKQVFGMLLPSDCHVSDSESGGLIIASRAMASRLLKPKMNGDLWM